MVRDDDLLTDELRETLGKAAEPLSASARAQIRERVMQGVRSDSRGGLFMLASHRVAALATAVAMLGGGVAYAANGSLPGEMLYGLKIAAENAAVWILPPGRLENRLLVGIAARRARETAALAREGSHQGAVDDSLGALREAVRQATPAEGTLGTEEAHRIRQQGADAPAQTREAIDDAVSSPNQPTAPSGGGSGTGPGSGPGTGGGGSLDSGTGSPSTGGGDFGGPGGYEPTPESTSGPNVLEPSREASGSPKPR